jgi:choline-sulfatase
MQMYDGHQPFFSYFHLFSPHSPYKPGRRFYKLFEEDGFVPLAKPMHPLGFKLSDADVNSKRLLYDQQVAHVDAEFGKLLDLLEQRGVLENSYIIVTSDHGEIFERGFYGHGGPILNEPVIACPLMILSPGQTIGQVTNSLTCNIDVLPTVAHMAGMPVPDSVDGSLLPGFGGGEDESRSIFSIYAGENSVYHPIKKASVAMRKGVYKLIAYLGYFEDEAVYEFYDLSSDPEEVKDLSPDDPTIFLQMKDELHDRLADADRPYSNE